MNRFLTNSERETIKLGKKLAKKFKGGQVIALFGNLGAGKTTLIKGIAQGLGVKRIITSPTFILMNLYKIKSQISKLKTTTKNSKLKFFIHIDCYRINKPEDILNIGATEYFGDPNSIVVIEWAEKIKKILPKDAIIIKISILDKSKRVFSLNKKGFADKLQTP